MIGLLFIIYERKNIYRKHVIEKWKQNELKAKCKENTDMTIVYIQVYEIKIYDSTKLPK